MPSPRRTWNTVVSPSGSHRAYYLMARETLLDLALGRATNGGKGLGHERAVLDALRAGSPRCPSRLAEVRFSRSADRPGG